MAYIHKRCFYIYTHGSKRTSFENYAHCSDLAQSPCSLPFPNSPSDAPVKSNFTAGERPKDRGCWTTPSVDRLVIIVLDALRFDFVAPSTFFKDKKPWMDKLRVLQKLASEEGLSARIFKAIADPPTTSLQRLKGLTTGGLPTFIDVGNSFGAPAIVEDNLMHQLVKNGKRVLMMGDDTWMQLFPDHFNISYPYPSFDVKDLDTVDNGVIEHLIPSLYKEDWDVLIAHFLGVDHAGHIFGVESEQMINKLEQYNRILEEVVNVLKNQSGAGSLHENTFLIVMGDHGQTTNGDHGGGTAEEVETSVFAMSLKSSPTSISSVLDSDFCHPDLYGKRLCIGIFEQLDFAVTISALLGLPFPFGSIGHVDAELYALSARTWESEGTNTDGCEVLSDLAAWKQNYLKALCINSWQVQRYIDLYSTTSVIGLPLEDLYHVAQLYSEAQSSWSDTMNISCLHGDMGNNILDSLDSSFQQQIDAYSNYLRSVSKLARSAWTEFDLSFMGVGFIFMLISLGFHLVSIRRLSMLCQPYYGGMDVFGIRFSLVSAFLLVAIRAASFLSNSYILAEGRVASFLLSTAGILRLWCSISNWKFPTYELLLLFLNTIIRHGIVAGMLKETSGSTSLFTFYKFIFHTDEKDPMLIVLTYSLPIISLSILAIMISRFLSATSSRIFTFLQYIGKNLAPRLVYAIGFGLLVPSVLSQFLVNGILTIKILILWKIIVCLIIIRSSRLESKRRDLGVLIIDPTTMLHSRSSYSFILSFSWVWGALLIKNQHRRIVLLVTTISLIECSSSVCFFFFTPNLYDLTFYRCAFDGLRYGAAFIGFDHFNIIRQGFLLAIDTFGVSHILPILGIPFIVILKLQNSNKRVSVDNIFLSLTQVFLIYGLITSTTTTLTIVCVAIQRRHLMVWGLFAPKYVFDAIGLLLTDVLILMASLYYY
ncbi:hypothetical protein ZIOFF_031160 [Zingiber officinale]|uniref:GPI ethanolamine phosphate transferase 3 n=1 Tax=Zingiber officinale TaxID=94328 RepID=A0A8J5LC99_ZINOF|nr:hypothetical protein ZIOFF_031160 [Zingiber officinale]